VIPGEVTFSLDLRSADATRLASAYEALHAKAEAVASLRNLGLTWNLIQYTAPITCDAALNKVLTQAITESGYEVVSLVSGAGHDAVPISAVSPATMMFVRCFKGISHNPLENVEERDLAAALQVAERFLSSLISS
jgi:allantoate deiminase